VAAALLVAAPLALLLLDVRAGRLTANPIQELEQQTGKAAYLLLLGSLAVGPLTRSAGRMWAWARRRQPPASGPPAGAPERSRLGPAAVLGWGAFAWAAAHLLIFVGLDYGFDPALIWGAVADKRFALVGLGGLVLLLVRGLPARRRRGPAGAATGPTPGRRARVVGLLTPLAAVLVTLHYLWAVKVITSKELAYAALTVLVLGLRLLDPGPSSRGGSGPAAVNSDRPG